MRSCDISTFLRAHATREEAGEPEQDVVYMLFAEPLDYDARWSTGERCINAVVSMFQPSPPLAHCELLVPPGVGADAMRTQFATYLGRESSWQLDRVDGYSFYLQDYANKWRALPVFAPRAASRIRAEAELQEGVPYSLLRYVTATRGFRWLGRLVSNARRAPAQCAGLSARVLQYALQSQAPCPRPASSYGPTTLFYDVRRVAEVQGDALGAESVVFADDVAESVNVLLHQPMTAETVQELGDERCLHAVKALTMRVCASLSAGDEAAARVTQKQLATALLRWVLLRADAASPTVES